MFKRSIFIHSIAALILLPLFFSGCASTKYNYTPRAKDVSEPPLKSIVTVQIGDEMVKSGIVMEWSAIYVSDTIIANYLSLGSYTITVGYFKKCGEDDKYEYYKPFNGADSGDIISRGLEPWDSIRYSKEGKTFGLASTNGWYVSASDDNVRRVTRQFSDGDSFMQSLIYSGKVGNKIKLGYREFSNNLARPAFSNDVEYDLTESTIVGYKGARIEVIEATNQYIKYQVLQSFNQPR